MTYFVIAGNHKKGMMTVYFDYYIRNLLKKSAVSANIAFVVLFKVVGPVTHEKPLVPN